MYPGLPFLFLALRQAVALEVCNGVDDDGDGSSDEGPVLAGSDLDADGYGSDVAALWPDCGWVPVGHLPDGSDCDDGQASIDPGAPQACDASDHDCDGDLDEGACAGAVSSEDDIAFLRVSGGVQWADAVAGCAVVGWEIVTPSDANEQDAVTDVVDGFAVPYWIGLSDASAEGTWVWADGGTATVTAWLAGQPDNGGLYGDEGCAVIQNTGLWSDQPCTDTYGYVCERPCTERIWHDDDDEDGLGDANTQKVDCEAPARRVANGLDCDDHDPDLPRVFYADHDLDGFGETPFVDCVGLGGSLVGGDCLDTDPTAYPGATEVPGDGVDQDCDGVDAPLPTDTGTAPWTPWTSPTDTGSPGSDGGTDGPGTDDIGTVPRDEDSDGDGVPDRVDPDPDDAGGVLRAPPRPFTACSCGSMDARAVIGLAPWFAAFVGRNARGRRRITPPRHR